MHFSINSTAVILYVCNSIRVRRDYAKRQTPELPITVILAEGGTSTDLDLDAQARVI